MSANPKFPLLQMAGVCKGYGPPDARTEVLDNVNLDIAPGEFLAIVGYSGAGKTTLVSLLAGLLKPDSGQVLQSGKPIAGPVPERGLVFQNYSLLPWLTTFENVLLAVNQVYSNWTREQKRERVEQYLKLVGLGKAAHKKPSELSGGMRQRVAFARALSVQPQVLLLDEPLSALDALTRASLQDELDRIREQEKRTILLITNDVDEGILLADRIIPLSAGPKATLGPAIAIDIERPRDRKAINHDPKYRRIRNEVLAYLLGPGAANRRRKEAVAS